MVNTERVDRLLKIKRSMDKLEEEKKELLAELKKSSSPLIRGTLGVAHLVEASKTTVAYSKLPEKEKERLERLGVVNHSSYVMVRLEFNK